MMFKPVFLATDYVLFGLLAALIIYVVHVCRTDELKMRWSHVFHSPTALCTFTILSIFLAFAVLDSIHFRPAIDSSNNHVVYDVKTYSLLDKALGKAASAEEKVILNLLPAKPSKKFQDSKTASLFVITSR